MTDADFCMGKEAGNYPFEADCTIFVQCLDDGTQYITPCAHGTHYDAASDKCLWKNEADCGK